MPSLPTFLSIAKAGLQTAWADDSGFHAAIEHRGGQAHAPGNFADPATLAAQFANHEKFHQSHHFKAFVQIRKNSCGRANVAIPPFLNLRAGIFNRFPHLLARNEPYQVASAAASDGASNKQPN